VTLGWGLIGTGRHADFMVAPAINRGEEGTIVAVMSRDIGRATAFAERHAAALTTDSVDQLLSDDRVDIVYVGTPNATHAALVVQALRMGKHVLCDKPLATSVSDAIAAVQLAQHDHRKLGVCFQLRHHPAHQQARELIRDGVIGDVVSARADAGSFGAAADWRTSRELATAGVIFDLGVHVLDLLRFTLGLEVCEVAALSDRTADQWLDQTTIALLRFENGGLGVAGADHRDSVPKRLLEVRGTTGRITCIDTTDLSWGRGERRSRMVISSSNGEKARVYDVSDTVDRLIADFNRAVLEDREPLASGIDGLRSVEIVDAVLRSLNQEARVTVEATTTSQLAESGGVQR
jgi:predicted dehydrogenase